MPGSRSNNMQLLKDALELDKRKRDEALFVLFGGENCSVCQSLRPQLTSMIEKRFPKMQSVYIDCNMSPEICAQHSVFSLPAVKVYIGGLLAVEEARVFSLDGLLRRIDRPYRTWSGQTD